jgi:hypothetical protein
MESGVAISRRVGEGGGSGGEMELDAASEQSDTPSSIVILDDVDLEKFSSSQQGGGHLKAKSELPQRGEDLLDHDASVQAAGPSRALPSRGSKSNIPDR